MLLSRGGEVAHHTRRPDRRPLPDVAAGIHAQADCECDALARLEPVRVSPSRTTAPRRLTQRSQCRQCVEKSPTPRRLNCPKAGARPEARAAKERRLDGENGAVDAAMVLDACSKSAASAPCAKPKTSLASSPPSQDHQSQVIDYHAQVGARTAKLLSRRSHPCADRQKEIQCNQIKHSTRGACQWRR
jgi:hypothetical protein